MRGESVGLRLFPLFRRSNAFVRSRDCGPGPLRSMPISSQHVAVGNIQQREQQMLGVYLGIRLRATHAAMDASTALREVALSLGNQGFEVETHDLS